jgi:hypothetical protein
MRNLKKLLALTLVVALVVSIALPAMAKPISEFPDADLTEAYLADKGDLRSAYENAAQLMVDLEVVQGHTGATADRGLDLAGLLTRGQFAALLYRAVNGGDDIPAFLLTADPFFGDTPVGSWFTPYATWMGQMGISEGMSYNVNGKPAFEPDTPINFSMAALLCMRAIGFEDDKEGFVYSEAAALLVAWTEGLLDNVAGDGTVDRGNAFVLLENTIRARQFNYVSAVGGQLAIWARNYDVDPTGILRPFLEKAFGISERNFTILSDAEWFAMEGSKGGGEARISRDRGEIRLEYIASWAGTTPFYEYRVLDGAAAEKLGITMYDVGRNVTIFYRIPAGSGPNANRIMTVVGGMRYNDDMMVRKGVGSAGLAAHVAAAAGSSRSFTTNTHFFINYNEYDELGVGPGQAFQTTTKYNFLARTGGDAWRTNVGTLNRLGEINDCFGDSEIRVIYDGRFVKAVFVETYTYGKYSGLNNNGKVIVTSGEYEQNVALRGSIHGADSWAVKDLDTLEINAEFLSFEIGTDRWAIKPTEFTIVEGFADDYSGWGLRIGGTRYWSTNGIRGAGEGPSTGDLFRGFFGVGGVNRTLRAVLLNGDILELSEVEAGPANYAVVTAIAAESSFWLGAGDRYIWARILTADDEAIEGRVNVGTGGNFIDVSDVATWTAYDNTLATYSVNDAGVITLGNAGRVVGTANIDRNSTGITRFEPTATGGGGVVGFTTDSTPVFIETGSGWRVFSAPTLPPTNSGSQASNLYLGGNIGGNASARTVLAAAVRNTNTAQPDFKWAVMIDTQPLQSVINGTPRWGLNVMLDDGSTANLWLDSGTWAAQGITTTGQLFGYRMSGGLVTAVTLNRAEFGATIFAELGVLNGANLAGFFSHTTALNGANATTFTGQNLFRVSEWWGTTGKIADGDGMVALANDDNDFGIYGFKQNSWDPWNFVFVRGMTSGYTYPQLAVTINIPAHTAESYYVALTIDGMGGNFADSPVALEVSGGVEQATVRPGFGFAGTKALTLWFRTDGSAGTITIPAAGFKDATTVRANITPNPVVAPDDFDSAAALYPFLTIADFTADTTYTIVGAASDNADEIYLEGTVVQIGTGGAHILRLLGNNVISDFLSEIGTDAGNGFSLDEGSLVDAITFDEDGYYAMTEDHADLFAPVVTLTVTNGSGGEVGIKGTSGSDYTFVLNANAGIYNFMGGTSSFILEIAGDIGILALEGASHIEIALTGGDTFTIDTLCITNLESDGPDLDNFDGAITNTCDGDDCAFCG